MIDIGIAGTALILHHAGGGDRLVECLQALEVPPSPPRLLVTLSRRHTRTSLSAGPLSVVSVIFEVLILSSTSRPSSSIWSVYSRRGLVPALHHQRGAGGGEPRLHRLLVTLALTDVAFPHPLDRVLNVRQLTDLRLCKVNILLISAFYFKCENICLKKVPTAPGKLILCKSGRKCQIFFTPE